MTLPASVSPYWGSQLLPSGKARWLVYTLKIVMDHQEHDTSQVAQWQRICLPMQETGDTGSVPGSGRSPGGRSGNSVLLPGKSHGQRSLAGCSPWGGRELDMAVQWLTLGLPSLTRG